MVNGVVSRVLSVIVLLCVLACSQKALGQDKLELGVFLGGAYYLGDLNPNQHFLHTRPALGVLGRYAFNDRVALKINVTGAMLKGEYPSGGNIYPNYSDYEFKRFICDVGAMGEFNFLSYDHMFFKDKSTFTPYLTLGLAGTIYKSYKDNDDGKQRIVLSLPFGFGVKYKVNKWLRLGMAWTMRKTFCDDLDMDEKHYGGVDPSDPYGFNTKVLTHNNDWYSLIGVTVTFSMWPRVVPCNDGSRNFNR